MFGTKTAKYALDFSRVLAKEVGDLKWQNENLERCIHLLITEHESFYYQVTGKHSYIIEKLRANGVKI